MPEEIKKQPIITEDIFLNFLKERQGFLEGVCVCGGEPTLQGDLLSFIKKIKALGYLVKLDTNGSNPKVIQKAIGQKLLDYIAMDVKAPSLNYNEATGVTVDVEAIKKSVRIIKNSGVDYEFRTTVVPFLHTKDDILEIARELSPAAKYYLQDFRPEKTINPCFEKFIDKPREWLLDIQAAISPLFDICRVR